MSAAVSPSGLSIRLLGEPEIVLGGLVKTLPASKKTRALLGYLVKTGRPQRRERLCELLWDGPDDPRAGLRWSLAKLRPLTDSEGTVRIVADRERVAFELHGADVDVLAVSALAASGLASASTEALAAAAQRFRGPFLEGLELSSCPAFHAWCVAERESLRALQVDLLTLLVERQRADPGRALAHARSLVALDPLAESPRLLLLDVLAAAGDVRRALDEYESYARTLSRELGVKPSFEMEKRRMALGRAPLGGSVPALEPDKPEASPLAAPFVGRKRERALLEGLLDGAGRGKPVSLVLGEPGIGKSRLLEELARSARERGGAALSGRAFEAELVRPYGAFIDALQSGDGGLERVKNAEPLLPSPFAGELGDRTRLYDAVASALAEAARKRPPLVVALDDLHWFDEASAELFHYLARRLKDVPVLLAASARAGELADNSAAQRLVRALGRERLAESIELGPLAAEELRALVVAASPGVAAERVLAESGGNPLFALEAARALGRGSQDLVLSLSQLMSDRLGRLQETERGLLCWAAALGRSFDVEVLARVTGLSAAELLACLERLERHAILRSRDAGYDFVHDLMRQAAYRQMSGPRQRLVHREIARALAESADPEGILAGDIAHHAALGGEVGAATRACIQAARRCLRLFASGEARELAQRGSRLAASLPELERVPLLVELIAIHVIADPQARLERQIASLADQARDLGLAAVEARTFFLQSVLQFRAEDSNAAFQSSLLRIEATRHATPAELGAELAGAARCFLLIEKNLDFAEQSLVRARTLLGAGQEPLDLSWGEGLLAHMRGNLDRAAERIGRTLLVARREHEHWEQCECLLQLALIELSRGSYEPVRAHVEELVRVSAKVGEGAYGAVAESLRALATRSSPSRDFEPNWVAFDASLAALHEAGANRLLAIVQNSAAQVAAASGLDERARRFAEEALLAASKVERVNEMVLARAMLAEIALRAGDAGLAREHLDGLASHAKSPDLSARSLETLERMRKITS